MQLYFEALAALESDPVFKHHTRDDLDTVSSGSGVHDVVVNREQMSSSRARHERIQRFFATTRPTAGTIRGCVRCGRDQVRVRLPDRR